MNYRLIRTCLFIFLSLFFCEIVTSQHEVDSLRNLLKTEKDSDKRFTLMSEMVRFTLWSEPDSAIHFSEVYLQEAIKANNRSETARGYNFLGLCYQTRGYIEKAIPNYLTALPVYEELRDTFMIAMMYNNIGASYQYREKYNETLEYFQKALELFQAIHDREWEASVKFNMGVQLNLMGKFQEAFHTNVECEKIFSELGNQLYRGYSELGIGSNLQEMGRFREAIGHYELASKYINPSEDKLVFANISSNLCNCYTSLDQLDSAAVNCQKAFDIANEFGAIKELADVHENFMAYYKKAGDFTKALEHLELYNVYRDSLFNSEKDTKITDMLTKYESEKKEQELEISKLKLEEEENSKRLLAGGIGITGLFLIGAVYMIYTRNKSNKKLAEKNAVIGKALSEKEILLKEIHHRVKNNLQVVSSLLSIQSRAISDEKAQEAITESRNRVRSMALIHQNLYSEENLTGIEMSDYIRRLAQSLFNTYQVSNDDIEIRFDVQSMVLDIDTTIPLGLILNELITNTLKYAYVGRKEGIILISLKETSSGLQLSVSDDGVGTGKVQHSNNSFGMKMIESFAQKLEATWQMTGGIINGERGPGTTVELTIKRYKKAAA